MNQFKTSREIKAIVRGRLLGNYKTAILAYVIMEGITGIALSLVNQPAKNPTAMGNLIYWAVYFILTLLSGVFAVGQFHIYRKILHNMQTEIKDMFAGFSMHPDKAILITFLTFVIGFLGGIPFCISTFILGLTRSFYLVPIVSILFILFIVFLVYINLTFSQALFLLMDFPEESATELMKRSSVLMRGNKFKLFYLNVSFIGILSVTVLTCGLGMLWAYPYMTCSKAVFYEELMRNHMSAKATDNTTASVPPANPPQNASDLQDEMPHIDIEV